MMKSNDSGTGGCGCCCGGAVVGDDVAIKIIYQQFVIPSRIFISSPQEPSKPSTASGLIATNSYA
jgi:hypothetical protein